MRKVVLQNLIAVDILTAAQEGTSTFIRQECCTYIPAYDSNISDLLTHMNKATD